MTRAEAFAAIKDRNGIRVVGEFSGGSDEGGPEGFVIETANGANTEVAYNDPLYEALSEPIYDRFGSFGGEGDIYGSITWEVETEKVFIDHTCTEPVAQPRIEA